MSRVNNEMIKTKTGHDWAYWIKWLNGRGAQNLTHGQIVKMLQAQCSSHWYCQTIAGTYEREFLGRRVHEMPKGFQVSTSKTIAVNTGELETAFLSKTDWPEGDLHISTHHAQKTIRGEWTGASGGRLAVLFENKDEENSRIILTHMNLPSEGAAHHMKTAWRQSLSHLRKRLQT